MTNNKKPYHIYLFLFGAFYYWIFPLITLNCGFIDGMPGVSLLDKYDYKPFETKYYCVVLSLCISFVTGGVIPLYFKKKSCKKDRREERNICARDLMLFSLPFFLFTQVTIYKARNILFMGYSVDYDIQTMGALATANCLFLFFFLYAISTHSFSRWYRLYFLFVLIEISVMLLGLGSRMYVMIPIVAGGIYYLQTHKLSKKMIIYAVFVVIFFLAVGVWRISKEGFNFKLLLYIGSAEPLLTWISAVSFFEYNDISLFSFPSNFLTSFVNFIPTFIFPDKADLILPLSSEFDSPLGATNLLTSLLSDFGILGSCLLLFITSFILTLVRYDWISIFGVIYYCCICGIIPFQFFRDNFSIINKVVLFNFLLIPFVIISLTKIICLFQKGKMTNDVQVCAHKGMKDADPR